MRLSSAVRARATACVLVTAVLGGCGSAASSREEADAVERECRPGRTHEPGRSRLAIRVGDAEREYVLVVPAGYDGSVPSPLVVVFHGAGGSPDSRPRSEFELDEIWSRSFAFPPDTVVAVPQAAGSAWRSSASSPDGDFAAALLDDVEGRLCIDPARIYATGISSGGTMVSSLACRLSDRLAAVGTAIGMLYPFEGCRSARPVAIVSVIGERDPRFPADRLASAHASWARNNGCEPEPAVEVLASGVSLTRYDGCAGDATVALYVVPGMGHQQALDDCSHMPEAVRDNVCFESEFDFRRTQADFFRRQAKP